MTIMDLVHLPCIHLAAVIVGLFSLKRFHNTTIVITDHKLIKKSAEQEEQHLLSPSQIPGLTYDHPIRPPAGDTVRRHLTDAAQDHPPVFHVAELRKGTLEGASRCCMISSRCPKTTCCIPGGTATASPTRWSLASVPKRSTTSTWASSSI